MHRAAVLACGEPIGPFGNDFQCGTPGGPPRTRPAQAGELWILDLGIEYRGYFSDAPGGVESNAEDIDRIRKFFGVTRILVEHTRVPSITPLYEGKVIAVQVYPRHRDDGSVEFEALLIRDGELFRARPDGSSERLSY